jgi:hypothetical protein
VVAAVFFVVVAVPDFLPGVVDFVSADCVCANAAIANAAMMAKAEIFIIRFCS